MQKLFSLISAFALLTSACTRPDYYQKAVSLLPKSDRADAKSRLDVCDDLAEKIAPSSDKSGEFSALGVNFGVRAAEFKNTSVKDQYLLALLNSIRVCREWAIFRASDDDYTNSWLQMTSVAEGAYKPEEVEAKLQTLLDAFKANDRLPRSNRVLQAQDIEQFRALATDQTQVAQRLAIIEQLLRELRDRSGTHGLGQTSSRIAGESGILGRGQTGPVTQSQRETSERTWKFGFVTNSSRLDPAQLATQPDEITRFTGDCKDWRGSVIGFADARGDDAQNAALSIARANEVTRRLGLNNYRVVQSGGWGESKLFGAEYASNRVVTVTLWCAK